MANCQGKLSHFSVMLCAKLLHSCPTLCSPIDCSPPGSSIHGILQAEYGSGLPCPPPGNLLTPGIKPASLMSPVLAGEFFTTRATWEATCIDYTTFKVIIKCWLYSLCYTVYPYSLHKLIVAAAAAKSLQSCPTLCDLVDGSPPGSPVPGIL